MEALSKYSLGEKTLSAQIYHFLLVWSEQCLEMEVYGPGSSPGLSPQRSDLLKVCWSVPNLCLLCRMRESEEATGSQMRLQLKPFKEGHI